MANHIVYGSTITFLLTCGYLRQIDSKTYGVKELITLITGYYCQIPPKFDVIHDASVDNRPYHEQKEPPPLQGKIKFNNINNTVSCIMPMEVGWHEKQIYFNKGIRPECITAIATKSWESKDLIDIIHTDNNYDYIYQFEMKVKKGIPSFGIGIISSNNMKYKYGYWICIENDFTKLDKRPFDTKSSVYCERIEQGLSDRHGQYFRQETKERDDIVCNCKQIATPMVGDTLLLTLNYLRGEIELFHNNIKINTFPFSVEYHTAFYPAFHIVPNFVRTYEDDQKPEMHLLELDIISCHLDKFEKKYITFNDYILDIEIKDNVCSQIIFEYCNSYDNQYLFDQCLCLKILGQELTGYKQFKLRKRRNNFHVDLVQNDGEILFDLLCNGYYTNLINLEHFNGKLKNIMHIAYDEFDKVQLKHLEKQKELSQHEYYYDGPDDHKYRAKYLHIAMIICNIWICIEMYQYFKNQSNHLIYDALFKKNKYFKGNENNSELIANIIIDFLLQNIDDDFEECFRNNNDFNKRISDIYMITHEVEHNTIIPLVFAHKWIDDHVLSKLNLPTMIYEMYISEEYYYSGHRKHYQWKHDYITKETVEYHPCVDEYGEDMRDDNQKDWLCNPLMLSKELGQILIYGYIRKLFEKSYINISKILTNEIPNLCVNYWYIHIPVCYNWLTGWLNLNFNNNKYDAKNIPFVIDYNTGIITINKRDSGYLDGFSDNSSFGCFEYTKYDHCDIVEGIWKSITDEMIQKNYVHVLEMKIVENVHDDHKSKFGIGVVSLFMTFMLELFKSKDESNNKYSTYLCLKGRTEIESYDTIKCMEIDEINNDDVLSIIVDYNIPKITFYFNQKPFFSYYVGIVGESVFTKKYEDHTYWHPLFEFNTNKDKTNISKVQILTCHLQKAPNYYKWYDDNITDGILQINKYGQDKLLDNGNCHLLFSVGNNYFGQQGHGDMYVQSARQQIFFNNNKVLKLMKYFPNNKHIKKITFGYNGTPYFLTTNGDLYVCGGNDYLTLGLNSFEVKNDEEIQENDYQHITTKFTSQHPEDEKTKRKDLKLMEPMKLKIPFKIANISDGVHTLHRFIMSNDNKIYGIGRNEYGNIGVTSTSNIIGYFNPGPWQSHHGSRLICMQSQQQGLIEKFTLLDHFNKNGINIKKIQCGLNFSVFLGQSGNVYYHGITGLKQFESKDNDNMCLKVNEIHQINDIENIDDVNCTEENIFLLNNNGNVYEWNYLNDEQIKSLQTTTLIIQINCGYDHCVFLDKSGNVYCKGSNYLCQLGNGDEDNVCHVNELQLNKILSSFNVIDIKCGSDHSMAKIDENKYFLWGSNDYNQCLVYDDNIDKVSIPTKYNYANIKHGLSIIDMYLGWKQTIVVTQLNLNTQSEMIDID
eukprot:210571_1